VSYKPVLTSFRIVKDYNATFYILEILFPQEYMLTKTSAYFEALDQHKEHKIM